MNLIEKAFQELFPEQSFNYTTILKYNQKLGDFNANVRLYNNILQFNLNKNWKTIDSEIQLGLIQTLMLRMFAKKYGPRNTFNIELYNNFIKKLPGITPITKTNPILESSFNRVNQTYFNNLLDLPNLKWGTSSSRKLASYNFHNDTITVSTIFQDVSEPILDYLMYHELLHKKQKFLYKNGKNYFHTRIFRQAEKQFLNQTIIEKQIKEKIKSYQQQKHQWFPQKIFRFW